MTMHSEQFDKSTPVRNVLVPSALLPFRALLWIGLALVAVAVIAMAIGFTQSGYGSELTQASSFAFAGGCIQWGVPFLVGSGIIAGLGKREVVSDTTPPAAYSAYVPVEE